MPRTNDALALEMGEVKRQIAGLREAVEQLDDWSNGVFAALLDLSQHLLKESPALAQKLMPLWQLASERFSELEAEEQAADLNETPELFEARKMLYRILLRYGIPLDQG